MGRRINLTIDGLQRKRQQAAAEDDQHVVWPTMLEDDAQVIRQFVFKFFRGDTKWDPTQNDNKGAWVTIPEWTGALSEKGRVKWAASGLGSYAYRHEDIDYVYIGNDFLVSKDQLQAEYGSEVTEDAKWKRLPLQIVTTRDDDTKRWTMFANGMNVRLRLLTNNDVENPKFDGSQDGIEDATKKGNWRFFDQTDTENPDEFRLNGIVVPAKYGLEVSEVGTKSICHYVYQSDPGKSEPAYGIDWLDPEGIFICPFNTLDTGDTGNYKVTTEPDYEADEVDGHILMPLTKTDVEIYFMFRRWAYYSRLTQINQDEGHTTESQSMFSLTMTAHNYVEAELGDCPWTFDPNDNADKCEKYDNSCGADPTIWAASLIDCSGSSSESGVFANDSYPNKCCAWSAEYTYGWESGSCKAIASSSVGCPDLDDYYDCGGCAGTCYYQCDAYQVQTYGVPENASFSRYYGNTYVGLWWGPPPIGYYLPSLSERTLPAKFRYTLDPDAAWLDTVFNLVGDESQQDAVENLIASGKTAEEAAKILGGYNSIHYHAPTEWAYIRVQNPNWNPADGISEFDTRWLLNKFCTTASGKLLAEQWTVNPNPPNPDDYLYCGTDDGLTTVWNTISRSEFMQNYWPEPVYVSDYRVDWPVESVGTWTPVPPYYLLSQESGNVTRNPWWNVPYGVGLSPMKAGSLCAIIKVGSKEYYVWRKTNEEFTERYMDVSGNIATRPFVTFDGPEPSGIYQFYIHFSGATDEVGSPVGGRKNTHILTTKSLQCARGNDYGLEKIDVTLDDGTLCEDVRQPFVLVGPGTVELESPVYPIISRERGIPQGYISDTYSIEKYGICLPVPWSGVYLGPAWSQRLMRDATTWLTTPPFNTFTEDQRNRY